ncbi:MAG: ACT domain-containing protein [Acidimicrobiales bacterium]
MLVPLAWLPCSSTASSSPGRRAGIVLSGGNIDPRTLSVVMLRGLGRQNRLVRLRVEIDDRPGALARVTTRIAELGANVVEVDHERMGASGCPIERGGVPSRHD